MLKMVFETYGFRRIEVQVPLYATKTLQAIENIGFVKEGTRRQAIFWRKEWYDVRLYSVLKEDLDGS